MITTERDEGRSFATTKNYKTNQTMPLNATWAHAKIELAAQCLSLSIPSSRNGSPGVSPSPTEPQALGWPEIRAGTTSSSPRPRAPGKRWQRFFLCLDDLVRVSRAGALEDRVEMIYVSPLRRSATISRESGVPAG